MAEGYDWLSTERGEDVVWTGRPRRWSVFSTVVGTTIQVAIVAGIVLAVWWFGFAAGIVAQFPVAIPRIAYPAVIVLVVLWGVVRIAWAYTVIANKEYVLTTDSLYKKTGVFSETVTQIGLERIQSTELSKDFFGNTFDYGTVHVSTAGSSGVEMSLTDLNGPEELRDELNTRMGAASARAEPGAAPAAGRRDDDSETVRQLTEEARRMRETAERIEEVLG